MEAYGHQVEDASNQMLQVKGKEATQEILPSPPQSSTVDKGSDRGHLIFKNYFSSLTKYKDRVWWQA